MKNDKTEVGTMWEGLLSEPSLEQERRNPALARETFKYQGSWEKSRSSLIKEAKYSAKGQFLVIVFQASSNETYTYFNVPESIGKGLFEAAKDEKSLGQYFSKHIKKAFTFAKKPIQQKAESVQPSASLQTSGSSSQGEKRKRL